MHLIHVVRKRANWLPYCALVDFLKNFFCLCHLCTKKSSKLQRYVVCFNFFSFRKLSGDHFLPAGLFFFWTHHHGKQGMLAEQPIFCCCLYACISLACPTLNLPSCFKCKAAAVRACGAYWSHCKQYKQKTNSAATHKMTLSFHFVMQKCILMHLFWVSKERVFSIINAELCFLKKKQRSGGPVYSFLGR